MNLCIDNKSGAPIYDQIFTQLKNRILSGELGENEMLPSIRSLAKDLRISVITTKRAYEELEKAGYVYTVPAKGSYVVEKNTQLVREAYLTQIEDLLQKIFPLADGCGLGEEGLVEMLRLLWAQHESEKGDTL